MAYITWTDTLVNGDNVTQTHITNLKSDITAQVNGGLTNVNFSASAAIAESKITFATTGGHTHDGTTSTVISSSATTHYIKGCELVYNAADQVYATPGIMELNGSAYSRTTASTTIDLDTGGHFLYGSRAVSTWFYIYAYNDSGSTWDIKYSTQAPAYYNCSTSNTTGILRYRDYLSVWYRCIGAVRTDAVGSGNILNFFQRRDFIMWDVPVLITSVLSSDAWSAATSCATAMPAISTHGIFGLYMSSSGLTDSLFIRPNGSTWDTTYDGLSGPNAANYVAHQRHCMTDSSQQIQYQSTGGEDATYITVQGYILNIR